MHSLSNRFELQKAVSGEFRVSFSILIILCCSQNLLNSASSKLPALLSKRTTISLYMDILVKKTEKCRGKNPPAPPLGSQCETLLFFFRLCKRQKEQKTKIKGKPYKRGSLYRRRYRSHRCCPDRKRCSSRHCCTSYRRATHGKTRYLTPLGYFVNHWDSCH